MKTFGWAVAVMLLAACGGGGSTFGPVLEGALDSFCDKAVMCQGATDRSSCKSQLRSAIGSNVSEACEAVAADWIDCITALDCEQIATEASNPDICATEFSDANDVCG